MKSYADRINDHLHPLAINILQLMEEKQTNLALSADVTTKSALLNLVKQTAPHIAVLKTHIDIITDFDFSLIQELQELAKQYRFVIFEDRKFADIGNTVKLQYQEGIYRISDWADIVNAHPLPGMGIIEGLKQIGLPKNRSLLLLAEMSSQNNLITSEYTQKTIEFAQQHRDFVIGFVAQRRLVENPDFLYFMPGISNTASGDKLGQYYMSPEQAICQAGADIIIVGREIYQSDNPGKQAALLRDLGWLAYQKRIKQGLL